MRLVMETKFVVLDDFGKPVPHLEFVTGGFHPKYTPEHIMTPDSPVPVSTETLKMPNFKVGANHELTKYDFRGGSETLKQIMKNWAQEAMFDIGIKTIKELEERLARTGD